MAVPFSNTRFRVPRGFQNLLEGLVREVLRSQPEEIAAFSCLYFEKLMQDKLNGSEDASKKAAQAEDRFYNNQAFEKTDVDVGNPVHQEAATSIQSKYRQHHATKVVQEKREERAATSIQASFRGYQDRQVVKTMKDGSSVATRSEDGDKTGDLELESDAAAKEKQVKAQGFKSRENAGDVEDEVDIDLDDPETEKAAICIQAGYKGYKSRKEVTAVKSAEEKSMDLIEKETAPAEDDGVDDIDLNDPEVEAAAITIQAGYKGFKARKSLKGEDEEQVEGDAKPETPKAEEEEEEIDIDLEDPEVEAAAIKIQAGFKGFKSRKEKKEADTEEGNTEDVEAVEKVAEPESEELAKNKITPEPVEATEDAAKPEEEEIDIDLNDPEVEDAAIKIQAGFKNFKQRKSIKAENAENETAGAEETEKTSEETPEAATEEIKEEVKEEPTEEPTTEQTTEEVKDEA